MSKSGIWGRYMDAAGANGLPPPSLGPGERMGAHPGWSVTPGSGFPPAEQRVSPVALVGPSLWSRPSIMRRQSADEVPVTGAGRRRRFVV